MQFDYQIWFFLGGKGTFHVEIKGYKPTKVINKRSVCYAPVICIPGSLGAGDSRDMTGPKCRNLTFDESRQCRRCARVLISRQNANLCHILTTRGKLSLYISTV